MKINKYIYFLILLGSSVNTFSCKEAIEIEPKHAISSDLALETEYDIEAALMGVYAKLRDVTLYGRDLLALAETLADNVVHTNVGGFRAEYNNDYGAHMSNWESGFEGINRANLVLEAVEKINAPSHWKDKIAGQAHFLRALFYFDLAKVYGYDPTARIPANDRGTVPIYTKGVIEIDDLVLVSRASVADTYTFLYKELDSATVKLTRNNNITGPHRATLAAVHALYSRVALHNGDYNKVISKSTAAINGGVGVFQGKDAYVRAWRLESHPESIFEVKFNQNENVGPNNSLRATYMSRSFISDLFPSTHGNIAVADNFKSLYSTQANFVDVRNGLIIKGLGNNVERNEMTKFSSRGGIKDLDNVPVIRVSEMYLNRAEAYWRLQNEVAANADLDRLRVRAGLPSVTYSSSALLEAILLERRLEFAFEGHRWFDLKRLGRDVVKTERTIPASDPRILARIPYREINASEGNVRQNRGY